MDRLGIATSLLSVSSPGVHLADAGGDPRPGPRGERGRPARGRRPPRPLRSARLAPAAGCRCRHRRDRPLRRHTSTSTGSSCSPTSVGPTSVIRTGTLCSDELDRRGARVLIHPTSPVCWEQTSFGRPRPMLEFLFDTTRAVVNLVLNGTVARHPDLAPHRPARGRHAPGHRRPRRRASPCCWASTPRSTCSATSPASTTTSPARRSPASSTRCSRSPRSSTSTTAATSRSPPTSSPRSPAERLDTAGDPPGSLTDALRANTERLFPRLAAAGR